MRFPTAALLLCVLQACFSPRPAPSEGGTIAATAAGSTGLNLPQTIQGTGSRSPLLGENVVTEGVVTLVLDGKDPVVVIQHPDGDGDPATSDALFVLGLAADPPLAPGERVTVRGVVTENGERTCIEQSRLVERRAGRLPEPVALGPEWPADLEALEGMRVTPAAPLTVLDLYDLGRYGTVRVGFAGRRFTRFSLAETGSTDEAENLLLDDGSLRQNPARIAWLAGDRLPRVGDRVTHATGVLEPSEQGWRLQCVDPVVLEHANPRPANPPVVEGELRIASLNVLNYFATLESRGADTDTELERQQVKLVSAITAIDADLFALIEIENDQGQALQRLADALNKEAGPGTWQPVADPEGGLGSDAIKMAFLYKPATLQPLTAARADRHEAHSRPPVGLTLRSVSGGEVFSVIASHFKSKGCGKAAGEQQDQGQGCWNALRVRQAQELARFASEVTAAVGDPDLLLLGDFNAYLEEDPLLELERAGYANLLRRLPMEDRYSYVYKGESGALDHALVSVELAASVSGIGIWHINADESPLLDYNLEFKPTDRFRPDPFRSSDHDPVLVGLKIR